jgi:hypothetical protein
MLLRGFRDGLSRSRWRREWAGRQRLPGFGNRLSSFDRPGRRGCIVEAEFELDATDTASEIAEELPDGFEIAVRRIHGVPQALSAKPVRSARHFQGVGLPRLDLDSHKYHFAGALSLRGSLNLPRTMVSEAAGRV